MRRIVLSSLLFACSVSAKNVTIEGVPGTAGIITVKGQPRDEVIWHKIGQPINFSPSSLQALSWRSLFEVLKVNVTSTNTANIKVMYNGGTNIPWLDPPDISHFLYQSLYRKYCASWFGGGSSVNCENVVLPRYGIWAPFGATQIAVTQETQPKFDYSITFRKEYDQLRAIRMGIGMFFFMFGSVFSHSQPVHYLVGTALGSVGFVLVLLFIGMRFVPGNKPAFAMVGAASATFMAWLYNTLSEALTAHVTQYLPYYIGLMAVGGFAGFAYTYKHPLDANSRFLCLLLIRIASVGLIVLEGSTSFLVSGTVIATMSLVLLLKRCGCSFGGCCRALCDKRPDEPLPDKEEPDYGGADDLASEENIYPTSHASSRPPSPVSSRPPTPVSSRPPSPVSYRSDFQREPLIAVGSSNSNVRTRPQDRNTQALSRTYPSANLSFSSNYPSLADEPVHHNSHSKLQYHKNDNFNSGFDFKDVPLPPVMPLAPEFILPPIGQSLNFDSAPSEADDPEQIFEDVHGKLEELETFIKDVRKRIPKRKIGDDERLPKVRRVEK